MRPFFVAEIGGNHGGSLKTALLLIDAAKESGADAVKFQTWTPDSMAIPGYIIESGPWKGRELLDLYRETHTPWAWHEELFRHARDIGIIPFSTPFDAPSVDFLESLGCEMYKVASFEIEDIPLLMKIGSTRKPVIVSTGMARLGNVLMARRALQSSGSTKITVLHCVSNYPAKINEMNLRRINVLFEYFDYVGLSDHSPGNLAAGMATALGASMIEKHLILDRAMQTPDAAFSSTPTEFKAMVDHCLLVDSMVNREIFTENPEKDSLPLRRSLYYSRDLNVGHIITAKDLKTARPALGLSPVRFDELIGKTLAWPVAENNPVKWDHF